MFRGLFKKTRLEILAQKQLTLKRTSTGGRGWVNKRGFKKKPHL
jgi:hypothetical protein